MSQYTFRKPTIGQQIDVVVAVTKEDMPALVRLLSALAVDDIQDLPFTELGAVVGDFTKAMLTWQEEKADDDLPAGVADYLASLF